VVKTLLCVHCNSEMQLYKISEVTAMTAAYFDIKIVLKLSALRRPIDAQYFLLDFQNVEFL